MIALILFCLSLVAAFIHLMVSKTPVTFPRMTEIALAYTFPFTVGIGGVIAVIAHAYYSKDMARVLDWPNRGPFQYEVAVAYAALALLGLLCLWQKRGFWLATALFALVFHLGIAFTHVVMLLSGDSSHYDAGSLLYLGQIVVPSLYFIFTIIYCLQNNWFFNNEG